MKLSVITINYNTSEMTLKALRNFLDMEKNLESEIILVDNNSKDALDEAVVEAMGVKLIRNKENRGFAAAVNQGIKTAQGEFVLFLNSDAFIKEEVITKAIDYLKNNERAGILGFKMEYPDGRFQPTFGRFPTFLREIFRFSGGYKLFNCGTLITKNSFTKKYFKQAVAVDWVSGGAMLVKKEVFSLAGLLDENYFFGVEDIDFCYRAKKTGLEVVYFPLAEVVHYHGFSSGGKRSTFSLGLEAKGFDYFFKKNMPKRKATRLIVKLMYKVKIGLFNLYFKKKAIN